MLRGVQVRNILMSRVRRLVEVRYGNPQNSACLCGRVHTSRTSLASSSRHRRRRRAIRWLQAVDIGAIVAHFLGFKQSTRACVFAVGTTGAIVAEHLRDIRHRHAEIVGDAQAPPTVSSALILLK
jgi:hypothetical protein